MTSEIRINVRTLERVLFLLVIIVLAALLVWRWPTAMVVSGPEESGVDEQLASLTTERDGLQTALAECERTLSLLEDAQSERAVVTPEPEPEPETPALSGRLDFTWRVTWSGQRVERVAVVLENGLDVSANPRYKLFWKSLEGTAVKYESDVFVRSGASETIVIVPSDIGFLSLAPSVTDELLMEFYDSDGVILERLEARVP